MESAPHYDAVVVGAGPIGLTLANLLGRYGVRTLLIERNATTVQEPRAVSIDDESLRTMQAAGLIDKVLEQVVAGYGSRYLDPKGRCFLEVLPTGVIYGYPRRNAFRQPVLEAQLREGLSRFPDLDAWFGWKLDRYVQDKDGVDLMLAGPDGAERTVRCDYLVGCDGHGSTVRSQMGLVLEGETFSEKWLIVDLGNSPAPERDTLVFCDVARPCIALPGPDLTRRFEFKLLPGETSEQILDAGTVDKLLADHGAAPGSVIKRKTVYTFHARIAPRWQDGRIFLAGDACHLTPPFAGQGMNSGVRDAHNIAWKLAAVTQGRLGPKLLDTYQGERLDHVREMIQLALRMGRIMGPPNRWVGALTQFAFRSLRVWPPARDYFAQMKYKPKPRFARGFQIPDQEDPRHTPVGRLLPQPEVVTRSGETVLLDAMLGEGFSLVALTDDARRFEAASRQPIWGILEARRVVVASEMVPGAGAVETAVAKTPLFPDRAGTVLLVRPDRYVAAAFPISQIEDAARRIQALHDDSWSGAAARPLERLAS